MGENPEYCDVSLPVPLDRVFTYRLPETLRHRVKAGCRVIVPFGARKLTGVVTRTHDDPPEVAPREALRLVDPEPVLDAELLKLGRWIADYYCAPMGEALRTMAPLAGAVRRSKVWQLTDQGRSATRQMFIGDEGHDPAVATLRMLEQRPLSESTLDKKIADAKKVLKALERKGLVTVDRSLEERDPMRAPSAKLRLEFKGRPAGVKLAKAERELVAFLELHPGSHNLGEVEKLIRGARGQ